MTLDQAVTLVLLLTLGNNKFLFFQLMALSKKVLGQWMFEKMMKMTFYGQFVAGEDHNSIKPLIKKNQAFGVGAVLDYSVEEDLTQEEAEKKEME